jgi:hypothetical protein
MKKTKSKNFETLSIEGIEIPAYKQTHNKKYAKIIITIMTKHVTKISN